MEHTRAHRFVSEQDRRRYLASHVALRTILASKLGVSPQALLFATGAHGKPFLQHSAPCYFNLSHSGDVALVAFSKDVEVGVDIEQERALSDAPGLVRRCFTPAEQKAWCLLARASRQRGFLHAWARKEACIKAVGWGLKIPLASVEVGVGSELATSVLCLPDESQSTVSVLSLELGTSWAAAVAWQHAQGPLATPLKHPDSLTAG